MAIEVVSVEETRPARIFTRSRNVLRGISRTVRRPRVKRILVVTGVAAIVAMGTAGYLLHSSYTYYANLVDTRLARGYLTSRAGIYAAPRTLRPGQALTAEGLQAILRRAGYVETAGGDIWSGSFTAPNGTVQIKPHYPAGQEGPETVDVNFNAEGRIARIAGDGATIAEFTLEPEVLSNDQSMKTGTRTALSYADLPPVLVHAILSIEDHRFFEHGGVDLAGIGRAFLRNVSDDRTVQGGSTITQQLVKNTYLSPERTWHRKYAEAMLALALEERLTKEEIFALYCNEIYLGQRGATGVRGMGQAARVYFNKDLKDLSLAEAATLAGMIQSPNRYTPDRHPEASAERRQMVLVGMVREGFISPDQATAAGAETLALAPVTGADAAAPYFVDYVNRVAEQQMTTMERTDERSPRIYTTIDTDLQTMAEAALKRQMDQLDAAYPDRAKKPQAALIAMDPRTGNVVAMVGGRSYADSQLNRVTDSLRQPGSTFKPFVYAAALETNISPVQKFFDGPHDFVYDNNKHYRPSNYGGGYSGRDVMMSSGLVRSLNTVTVDIAMNTGLKRVSRVAADFGLPRPEPYPSLALGTTEVTPLSLAAAYTAFANGGLRVEPNVIARISDSEGEEIIHAEPRTRQVIEPDTAYMITDMLQSVIERGTARRARGAAGNTAIAGKTGTSHDSWFIGYTPNLVCAVWVGFDDNTELGFTGAEAALPIWTEFIKNAVDARPEPYPSLALGTTEVTPLSLAAAYTAFANGGLRVEPNVIARISDSEGEEIIHAEPRTRQVIEPDTAYMITDMLQSVIERGTARRARGAAGNTAIAGKTGTSHDSWFIGYTPNLVCAVWVGFDDNTELGFTGAEAALPIWTEFIKNAVDSRPELGGKAFTVPTGINFVQVDPETARLASVECPQRETIAVTRAYAPNTECGLHFRKPMDPATERETTVTVAGLDTRTEGGSSGSATVNRPLLVLATQTEKDRGGKKLLISELVAGRTGN